MRIFSTRTVAALVGVATMAAASQAYATVIRHDDGCDGDSGPNCVKEYKFGDKDSITVTANTSDPGLVVHTDIKNSIYNKTFTLDLGESKTFALFDIWTNESSVNNGEDTVWKDITVSIDFVSPDMNVTTGGYTFGVITGHIFQSGKVQWDGPLGVCADDRIFTVSLSNEKFNTGLFGLNDGECYGATVDITIRQDACQGCDGGGDVPEPASLSILGLGAAALIARRRSRR